jgi:8-oxo-dGTP pyrophosphatase MutT (NUDIX family)
MTAPLAGVGEGVAFWRPRITHRLAGWDRRRAAVDPSARRAAVAITLLDRRDAANVLLIKRARRGLNAGQWALPGGKIDGDEGAVDAALRELQEETGLHASAADVLGLLDDFLTDSGYVITPVVVALPGSQRPTRSPAEVASLHPIPLLRLADPSVPRWGRSRSGGRVLQMPLRHDMVVHAPTGAILWQFAEVALRGVARRVQDIEEPEFTAH